MKNSIAKIGLILIAVIVFPTLFFSAYEVNNLSNNERIVDSIYSSQLSSIVFSLNQYSDDVINGWANQMDLGDKPQNNDSILRSFFHWNPSVQKVFFINDSNLFATSFSNPNSNDSLLFEHSLNDLLALNEKAIFKIKLYFKKGYRKILPIKVKIENHSLVLFALKNNSNNYAVCGLLFNSKAFIQDNLGPKVQGMAQDQFVISMFDKITDNEIYTSDLFGYEEYRIRLKDDLWLVENVEAGIYLQGDPIEQMVQERTRTNIIMIVLMDAVLLLGAWFVYRNVKQEIKLAQIKSEFVSNVSHEIKTPLALINMYSETLDMGRVKTEEKKREYYKVINKEAKRLSRMVNKILSFSKIESGRREYQFIDTDLNEVVGQICSTYQHHFKNSGFNCTVEMLDKVPLIKADEEALIDAINNLIDNAIKYSGDQKTIHISTGLINQRVFFAIKDSGIGINEKEQKLIFDKFYRVTDGNLAHKAKGSGIGLNIVKHIVESHEGEIALSSAIGKGSKFTLFFPIKT